MTDEAPAYGKIGDAIFQSSTSGTTSAANLEGATKALKGTSAKPIGRVDPGKDEKTQTR